MRRIMAIISAFALLMGVVGMSTATTPSTYDWEGNGYPNATCDAGSTTALWIWTGDNPLSLTINGQEQTGSWTQMGNGSWHWTITIDGANFPPTTASITYTGEAGTLTLSGCDEGGAQPSLTPAPTATPTGTVAAETSTPSLTPAPTATPATPAPTGTVAAETGTPSLTPAPTATPSGTVAAETGTPSLTAPPTDTFGSEPAPSDNGWRIVLIGLATMLISSLVFTALRRSSRRR